MPKVPLLHHKVLTLRGVGQQTTTETYSSSTTAAFPIGCGCRATAAAGAAADWGPIRFLDPFV